MKNISKSKSNSLPEGILSPLDPSLWGFLEVFRHQSISRAADFLDMDQGNLSRSIARLEKQLGEKLFFRHQRGMVPTERARKLDRTLRQMKGVWDQSVSSQGESSVSAAPLRVGFHLSSGLNYFPGLIGALQSLGVPGFDFQFGSSGEMVSKVMRRELDLAIAINTTKSKDLVIRPIAKESIELVSADPSSMATEMKMLLRNPDMLFVSGIKNKFVFTESIDVPNYEMIAEICSRNPSYVGILPSGVRQRYPALKVIRSLKDNIQVSAVTFPGSIIAGPLSKLFR